MSLPARSIQVKMFKIIFSIDSTNNISKKSSLKSPSSTKKKDAGIKKLAWDIALVRRTKDVYLVLQ